MNQKITGLTSLQEINDKVSTESVGELARLVREWGREHKVDNPDKQTLHCYEELGEIARLVIREDFDKKELTDEFGDVLVTVIILADILDIDLYDGLRQAYYKISKRNGKTVKGNFVKQDDL